MRIQFPRTKSIHLRSRFPCRDGFRQPIVSCYRCPLATGSGQCIATADRSFACRPSSMRRVLDMQRIRSRTFGRCSIERRCSHFETCFPFCICFDFQSYKIARLAALLEHYHVVLNEQRRSDTEPVSSSSINLSSEKLCSKVFCHHRLCRRSTSFMPTVPTSAARATPKMKITRSRTWAKRSQGCQVRARCTCEPRKALRFLQAIS